MNDNSLDQDLTRAWRPSGKVVASEQFQAWRDARDILQAAHEHLERAKQSAHKEGYQAGESEGRQAILRVLIDTQARSAQYLDQMDREVAAIVIALVERIIGETPKADRTLLAARQALSRLRRHKHVKVQVPPSEIERFRAALTDMPSPIGEPDWFAVEADPHLDEGECVIATQAGYIQAGIEAQLDNLRQTVCESLASRQEEN